MMAMPGNGNFYFARANGTTDWTNDLTDSIPDMGVLVDAQVAVPAQSGLIIQPAMNAKWRAECNANSLVRITRYRSKELKGQTDGMGT